MAAELANGSMAYDRNLALRDMMTQYGEEVWNFAYSLTRRPELADDVTQDVFLKAFHKLETFRGESSIKTWLLSITRNVAIDYRRSAFLRKVTLVAYITDRGSHPSAEREVLEQLVTEDVWRKTLQLSTKLREVLVLHAHHHLTIQEIAQMLHLSEAAVKSRLHRAREQVSILLQEGEDHEQR